ncbi:ligand-binding sensor domain-containing diguanylate cyclase [Desulfoluna sp.]|uniref:ligand-binding sensor domain-containing diguanylate cyclase n=1 Tax=Desulfoluna sp. TaxID=2045199 RepID=UPI00261AC257|nr:ligand-binding sensor domain-containing diguanylate cyclase [Desulfoluna sp.]
MFKTITYTLPVVLLMVFHSLSFAGASKTFFERISRNEGLPQVSVNAILQDPEGFIWVATQEGLARFDGYEFKTFKHSAKDKRSIADNSTWALARGTNGNLWIGTNGGLSRLDTITESFTTSRFEPDNDTSLSDLHVRCLFIDSKKRLWVGTRNGGLNSCVPEEDNALAFRRYPAGIENTSGTCGSSIRAICEDSTGLLWVATDKGLSCLNLNVPSRGFTHYRHTPGVRDSLSNDSVLTIYETQDGTLYVGTEDGLNRFNRAKKSFERFYHDPQNPQSLSHNTIATIIQDNTGHVWIGTKGGGLNHMDAKGSFTRFKHASDQPSSLSDNDVRSLLIDTQGILWIGTYGNGLNKRDLTTPCFSFFPHIPKDETSLSSHIILSIFKDSHQTLWVGTWGGGVNRLTDGKNRDAVFVNTPGNSTTMGSNTVWSMLEDKNGNLWFGTWGGGLSILPTDQRQNDHPRFINYTHDPEKPESLSSDSILALYQTSEGTVWMGTWGGGLVRVDKADQDLTKLHFTTWQNRPEDPASLSDNFIKAIGQDHLSNLWIGTWGGGINVLTAPDIATKTAPFKRHQNQWNDPKSLSHNDVLCFYEDPSEAMWVGTYGGGLNRYDAKAGTFTALTEEDGLSNNAVYSILPDSSGSLWLSTNQGINQFDPAAKSFAHYDSRDGLQGDEFNQGASFQSEDGHLYFGGIMGLSVFTPEEIVNNPFLPPVHLTALSVLHKEVPVSESGILTRAIHTTHSMTLPHHQATFSLKFSALNYRQSEKNQFAFTMEGLDDHWIKADSHQRTAHFTRLAPGHYTFRVKASNDDGLWNDTGTSLDITILAPWWATGWFRALALLAGLALMTALYSIRIQSLKKRQQDLEHQIELRTEEIRQQKDKIIKKNEVLRQKNTLLNTQADQLNTLARHDPLTRLYNRRGFLERVEGERTRAKRSHEPFAILLGDIDFFKQINDTHGHDAGDRLLIAISETLQGSVREQDTVARWGGEEFIILLSSTDASLAAIIGERIRKNVAELHVQTKKAEIGATLTLGVAIHDPKQSIDDCIAAADKALYKGKETGRNQVVLPQKIKVKK